jgi:hypothetical protein
MSKITTAALGTALALSAFGLGGCQTHPHPITVNTTSSPMHQIPTNDWWNYQFVYFPPQQVYFEPYSRTYFWYDQGLWEEGQDLPKSIQMRGGDAVVVRLQNEKPYVQHESVLRWHPNYFGSLPGSTATYHASTEAITQSELRAAIRMASTLEDLVELSGGFTNGGVQDMTGAAGNTTGFPNTNPTTTNTSNVQPGPTGTTGTVQGTVGSNTSPSTTTQSPTGSLISGAGETSPGTDN